MTNINGFSVFVCLNSLCNLILRQFQLLLFFTNLFQLIHFINSCNLSATNQLCTTKTRIINILMLLHLCFKSGNINFDLHYTFCKCIYKIYIYILILLLVQLISDHIEKHFDCLKEYKLYVLHRFSCQLVQISGMHQLPYFMVMHINNIEIFISYFLLIILFLLLLLHGDIESNRGPKKKKQTYFSLCHWNVNSLVAHKKQPYQLHIILSTDMTLFVYQQRVLQIQPYLTMTIYSSHGGM